MANIPSIMYIPMLNDMGLSLTRSILSNPDMQKFIHSNEKFDAVIIEQFVVDGLKILAHHFDAPLILLSSLGANQWSNYFMGNPGPPSYIPNLFLSYSAPMTFFQRIYNVFFEILSNLNHHFYLLPKSNELVHEFFPDAPHLDTVLFNTSLMFLNSHPSFYQPVPHVPAMVEVGGFHIRPPKKLPKELQEYLDNSKQGVIYFSLGSNVKSAKMPKEMKDVIVRTFSKLKMNVLWKWEDDVLPGQPKNVRTEKWLPQNDILAHPNVKLFISHGGLLSTTESIYHGKPILAIPIFADQQMNAIDAVKKGFAISLEFIGLTGEQFTSAINEMLNNPKYLENVQTRSKIMHDRPLTPQKELVYWTEYVIRHKGATHLRVAALDLNWYQYLLLDVFAFLAICSAAVFLGLKCLMKKICCRKPKTKEPKLKKN